MCIFAIEKFEAVRTTGKVHFFKLVKNGKCLFDDFYNAIIKDERHKKNILGILSTMDYMAETNALLPKEKYNSIKQGKNVIGYEFKKKDLRVYCVKPLENMVVIFGGYKKNQKDDIKKLERMIEETKGIIEELIVKNLKAI